MIDKNSGYTLINQLLTDMMYTLDQDKVFLTFSSKFEKLLSCEVVILLKIVDND
jgi:hypothetical protein